ncbi:MAG: cupin domain-containing protein [Acidobacteriales bacterium]|nr:cupin domain-containing protein [Terriglobales bacterium]
MNNKLTYPLIALCLCLTAAFVAADAGMPQFAFTPDQMKFGPPPPFIAPGAQVAVLEGNPAGSDGDYTVRVKMPDGYKIAPHWHPTRENVTVISGALKVGMGDKFEDSKMTSFPGGSFAYLDPNVHHYAQASGSTTIQIHGAAPLQFNYVNAADDPSKK